MDQTLNEDNYDLCECGDWRFLHKHGESYCNTDGCGCERFKKANTCKCGDVIPRSRDHCVECEARIAEAFQSRRERERVA
ncbi:MAG: hypothetical protein HY548_10245 [Elusimicrobia bacterium]|nr:hypothetical protein [Elusimicrobiota bacterium]